MAKCQLLQIMRCNIRRRYLIKVNSQLATLTADGNGDTKEVEVKAGTVYIKELSAPKGYMLDFPVSMSILNKSIKVSVTFGVSATVKVAVFPTSTFKAWTVESSI